MRHQLRAARLAALLATAGATCAFGLHPNSNNSNWFRRIDFGPSGQSVASGFAGLQPGDNYPQYLPGDPWALGLMGLTPQGFVTGMLSEEQMRNLPDDLLRDGLVGSSDHSVKINVPSAGTYSLSLYMGRMWDLNALDLLSTTDSLSVKINGVPVVGNLVPRFPQQRAGYLGAANNYRRFHFEVNVKPSDSPSVTIELDNGPGTSTPILGLELLQGFEASPVVLDRATNWLTAQSSDTTVNALVQSALDKMQGAAPDYDAARVELDSLIASTNPALRLTALWGKAWWIGWLRGEEDMGWRIDGGQPIELGYLNELESGLMALTGTYCDDSRIEPLLLDLRDYRDGVYQTLTRAYTYDPSNTQTFPNPRVFQVLTPKTKDRIIANMVAGHALLEQIDGDTLSLTAAPMRAPSPFRAKAQAWIHRSMTSRNHNLRIFPPAVLGGPWNQELMDLNARLLVRLDPNSAEQLFPNAHGARVQTWFFDQHAVFQYGYYVGLNSWGGVILPPGDDYDNAWWNAWTLGGAPVGDAQADDCIVQQRRMARMFTSLIEWFRRRRLYNIDPDTLGGELGGGDTDDVELASGASRTFVTRREDDQDLSSRFALGMMEFVLRGPGTNVHPEDAYWYESGDEVPDVEHASETSQLPLNYLLSARVGDPLFIDLAMRSTRNIDEEDNGYTGPPSANTTWTTPFSLVPGSRVFKSWKFDALRVGDPAVLENRFCGTYTAKALLSTYQLYDYLGDPKAERYLSELGQAWHDAAQTEGPVIGSTATGFKPKGLLPAGFDYLSGTLGWQGSTDAYVWYGAPDATAGGPDSFTDGIYSMIALAAELELNAARQDEMYDTIYSTFVTVGSLPLPAPGTNPMRGSDQWISNRVTNTVARFAQRMRATFESLNAQAGSALYSMDVIDGVILRSSEEYLKILEQPSANSGTSKDLSELAGQFKQGADLWYYLWPLSTEYVAFTDSVDNVADALFGIQASAGGAPLSDIPSNPVSWFDDSVGGTLQMEDVAIVVTEFNDDPSATNTLAMRALLNADVMGNVDIGLSLLRRFPTGNYRVEIGADLDGDQRIDGTPTVYPTVGGSVPVDQGPAQIGGIELAGGVSLVCEVHFDSALVPSSSSPVDLALLASSVSADSANNLVTIDVTNLGRLDYVLGMPGTLIDSRLRVVNATSGAVLGTLVLPNLDSPVDLVTTTVTLSVATSSLGQGEKIRVFIESDVNLPELNELNQSVTVIAQ